MHIIINAIGSAGDINPFLPLGSKLKELGHRVDFLVNPYFEEKVNRQGLNLIPLGTTEQFLTALNNPDVWNLEKAFPLVWKVTMEGAMLAYDLILKNYTPNDTLLIGSSLAVGARLAQEKLGIPMASVHLAPSLMISVYDTPQSATNPVPDWAPRAIKSFWRLATDALMLDPICKPPLNQVRAGLGLAPVSHVITDWLHSPNLVICAFPEWFAKVQADWPPNSYNTSFPLYKSAFDKGLSLDLQNFLDAGDPPIVVTAGSAMAFAGPFLKLGLQAAEKTNKRCVVVCNFDNQAPMNLPSNAIHVSYANFQLLFERAALVIHHGGIGTSAMAISCACPQIIAPFAHDQFDNAMRLEKIGVGKMIRRRDNLADWCDAIKFVSQPRVKESALKFKNVIASEPSSEDSIVSVLNQTLLK